MELQRLLINRRKVLYSMMLGATAFIFVLSCIILTSIECALQFQNQGFIGWTPLLTVAASFFVVGLIFALTAKTIFPVRMAQPQPEGQSQTTQILEFLMKSFVGDHGPPKVPDPGYRPAAPPPLKDAVHH
jgi:hypothetical protein